MSPAGKRTGKIYSVSTFTKISGFRRVVTCRNCGKRALLDKESSYCEKCDKAMQDR
ncbi:hypothetical protein HZB90_04950 [archaeon]|nr:hypothetical protein [archaeon]